MTPERHAGDAHAPARTTRWRPKAPSAAPGTRPPPPSVDGRRRVAVDRVQPEVDGGRFPIKRTVGEPVEVVAWVHADGHDVLVARLQHRPATGQDQAWTEVAMEPLGNDEWRASFVVELVGTHEYTVEAWVDHFLSWRRELAIKARAGVDVSTELIEGAQLVSAAAARCPRSPRARKSGRSQGTAHADTAPADDREHLDAAAAMLESDADASLRVSAALDDRLLELMARHADRRLASRYARVLQVEVNRERARFGAWYEMFPRSWGPNPSRSATFDEAAAHLPRVAALGFDVVYLPPIHPIGTSFRKGRGNTLVAGPNDPGSPWAIGSPEGGHKAVEPGLGTLDDFDAFVAAAHRVGLEVALDIAYQCSPDHPYVRDHPEWFRHRPDGTVKYAENPPKKYQDIYPFNFETEAWQALWVELASVIRFWIDHGVLIFRVDNPHTKPYAFWEWLIADIRRDHPDVIFLSEAFTRPKVMAYLAKLGFTQSYSYFTWRNTKTEIEEFFTGLATSGVREFLRPNLFANTPDILHAYLQTGGPPAFMVRLVLAATLGPSYGIYSGFELCEGRGVPGSEEYLDSEKYQIRHWDWDRPGHIRGLVAAVNRIRREQAALHYDRVTFHATDNPHIVAYSRTSPDHTSRVLVVLNVDPHNLQHGFIEVPVETLGADAGTPYRVRDLLSGDVYAWQGSRHYVRLDPAGVPAHILVRVP
ncbi:MAG: alpha-1,4-glucan--maltose-1-phosphate maltosyltransferase [Vicinamibacterales bacterium]